MNLSLHFLRPLFFLALIPWFVLAIALWRQNPSLHAWSAVCDKHLLNHLLQDQGANKRRQALAMLLISGLFMVIALTGPCWIKLATPVYQQLLPRVVVLDMSESMLDTELAPDRLTRAKFVLHDLFNRRNTGQLALLVYTGEPFVVSPLTEDGKTIDSLLPTLTNDIMPVDGQQLDTALQQAGDLIKQAGYQQGEVLVLTATPPDQRAILAAEKLARQQMFTSVMPIVVNQTLNRIYQPLASAGGGLVLSLDESKKSLDDWFKQANNAKYNLSELNDIPQWRDEGRWFLIPALLFLLPVFRRGWLQRIES